MTLSLTLLFSETRERSPEKRGYQIVVRRVHMIIVSKAIQQYIFIALSMLHSAHGS